MYIDEKVATKVCEELGLDKFPELDGEEYDELIFKLRTSEDPTRVQLADEIEGGIIFEGLGDPRHEQIQAEKAEKKKTKISRTFFKRKDKSGQFVLSRLKIPMWVLGIVGIIFTVIFFNNRFSNSATNVKETTENVEDSSGITNDSVNEDPSVTEVNEGITSQAQVAINVPDLNLDGFRLPNVTVNSPSGQRVSNNKAAEVSEASTNSGNVAPSNQSVNNQQNRPRPNDAVNHKTEETHTQLIAGEIAMQKREIENGGEKQLIIRNVQEEGGLVRQGNSSNTTASPSLIQRKESATNQNVVQRNHGLNNSENGAIVQRSLRDEYGIVTRNNVTDTDNIDNKLVEENGTINASGMQTHLNPSNGEMNIVDNSLSAESHDINVTQSNREASTFSINRRDYAENATVENEEDNKETNFLAWYASDGYTNEVIDVNEDGDSEKGSEVDNQEVSNQIGRSPERTLEMAEIGNFEEALQRARNNAERRKGNIRQSINYTIGQTIKGELIFGIMMTAGSNVPVLIIDENNAIWSGNASFNDISRVAIELDQYILNGQSYPIIATILGDDNYPGVPASLQQETPNMAAQMVQATLRGVSDYVDDLAKATSVSISKTGQVAVEDKTLPLEFAIAGSLTDLFAPPETTRSIIEVVKVEIGKKVNIIILGNGDEN